VGTLIGCVAAPLPPEDLFQWAASIWQVAPETRIILLADPAWGYQALNDYYGVEVVQAQLHTNPFDCPGGNDAWRGCVSIYKDRWDAIARIEGIEETEKVLLTDVRDVFFQRNPFPQIGEKITVATEGSTFATNRWCRFVLDKYLPEHRAFLSDKTIVCAGVIGGPWARIKGFADLVYEACGKRSGMVDQMVVNLVLHSQQVEWEAIPYSEGWCCHCASMLTPYALEAAKLHPRTEEMPLLSSKGHLMTRSQKAFAVVHHWQMVPQLKHFADVQ